MKTGKQLDYVIAPRCSKFEAHIHNGEKLRAWDHYSVSVAFKGEDDEVNIWKGRDAWAGWWLQDDQVMQHSKREVAGEEGVTSRRLLERYSCKVRDSGEEGEGNHINDEKEE